MYPHREGTTGDKHYLYVPLDRCDPAMAERTEEYAALLKAVVEDAKVKFETDAMEIFAPKQGA